MMAMTSHATINKSQSPLWGVLVCCTAIPPEQRGGMAAIIQQMGGVHKLDLTSDVTHLLAGSTDTPKYKYVARERPDIKVLRPEWLDAVRKSWIEGGDTDVAALEEQYRLPTFSGLRICLTGFDDVQRRTALSHAIATNGAEYHGDLTKVVSHLVAASPRGQKYDHALQWGIKIVSAEWIRDCLSRGMVLDEGYYGLSIPIEERGKGATIHRTESLPNLGKRSREDDAASDAMDLGRRKLRRTASAKLGSQSDGIWADIGKGKPAVAKFRESEWNDQIHHNVHEHASDTLNPPKEGGKTQDVKLSRSPTKPNDNSRVGIFDHHRVLIFEFDERKTAILQEHLKANGAILNTSDDEPVASNEFNRTAVIPHDLTPEKLSDLIDRNPVLQNCSKATEWWVERCLHRKILIDPATDVMSRPIRRFPLPGFSDETICPTSFTGVDLLHFSKLVKLLGGKYDESLNSNTTTLVCNTQTPNVEKLKYAIEHGIGVVTASWIWESVERMTKLPIEDFFLAGVPLPSKSEDCLSGFVQTIKTQESNSLKEKARQSEKRQGPRSVSRTAFSGRGRLDLVSSRSSRPASAASEDSVLSANASKNAEAPNLHPSNRPHPDRNPFQDEGDSPMEPLNNIAPEVNSPSKRSRSASSLPPNSSKPSMSRQGRENRNLDTQEDAMTSTEATVLLPTDDEPVQDQNGNAQALNDDIALLFAKKKATVSTASEKRASLRHRPLGRAVSNPSSVSAISRSSSQDAPRRLLLDEEPEATELKDKTKKMEDVLPSQILSYEQPDAQGVREKLMKRMGIDGNFDQIESGMKRVESIGLVKDSGIGDRVGNRRRNMRRK